MPKDSPAEQAAVNADGMVNVLTGVGTGKDPSSHTRYARDPLLDKRTLDAIFTGDGLGRKIVEMPAEEALRQWFEIEGDQGKEVCAELEALDACKHVTDALVWARLYGGAAIIRLINDGGNLEDELNRDNVREVMGYRVVDRHEIQWTTADLTMDASSPNYNMPEVYTISPSAGVPYRVHHSRISIIDGLRLPSTERQMNQGWGASSLQGSWNYLMRVGQNYGYTSSIMRDYVQSVLAINGLSEMLASGQEDLVRKRLDILDVSRSVINGMVIDADGETYSKSASSVAGLSELLDRHMEGLCGAAGIPMTKLVGRAAGGLNSNGQGETRDYYDALTAIRANAVGKATEAMVQDIYAARGGEPDQWRIKWASLYQPTDAEQAETEKRHAETDNIYWAMGATDSGEIRAKRFPELDPLDAGGE